MGRTIRALVVDDDPLVLRATCRLMRNFAETTHSVGARGALELLSQGERFDVVVSDISMPEISGKQFFEQVVQICPELATKFVFLTGGGSTHELEEFIRSAPIVLMKPVSVIALHQVIKKVAGDETEAGRD